MGAGIELETGDGKGLDIGGVSPGQDDKPINGLELEIPKQPTAMPEQEKKNEHHKISQEDDGEI